MEGNWIMNQFTLGNPPQWTDCPHFDPITEMRTPGDENPIVDARLRLVAYQLEILRSAAAAHIGKPCIVRVNAAYAPPGNGIHKPGSQHEHGAADIAILCSRTERPLSLWDQWMLAERCCQFTGLGCYTWWRTMGLHVDIRDESTWKRHVDIENPARWWSPRKRVYRPGITLETFKEAERKMA